MGYSDKLLLRETDKQPIPQLFDLTGDAFAPLTGAALGGGRYGADSIQWGKTAGGLYVPVLVGDTGKMQVTAELSGSSVDLRGLSADKPLATAVEVGITYWSVDTGEVEVSDGTSWVVV